jgi:hypothetical protein
MSELPLPQPEDKSLSDKELRKIGKRALSGRRGVDCCRDAAAELARDIGDDLYVVTNAFKSYILGDTPDFNPFNSPVRAIKKAFFGSTEPGIVGPFAGQLSLVPIAALAPAAAATFQEIAAAATFAIGIVLSQAGELSITRISPEDAPQALQEALRITVNRQLRKKRDLCELCIQKGLWKQSKKAQRFLYRVRTRIARKKAAIPTPPKSSATPPTGVP